MSAFYVMIIASIGVAAVFVGAFIWSIHSDQYSDKAGSAMRILHDDQNLN